MDFEHVFIALVSGLTTILVVLVGWIGKALAARIRHLEKIVIGPVGWAEMQRRVNIVEERQIKVLERLSGLEQHVSDSQQLLLSNSAKLDRLLERLSDQKEQR